MKINHVLNKTYVFHINYSHCSSYVWSWWKQVNILWIGSYINYLVLVIIYKYLNFELVNSSIKRSDFKNTIINSINLFF